MMWEQAVQASAYAPQERYILFVLTVEFAFMNTYTDGNPHPRRSNDHGFRLICSPELS